MVNSGKYGVSQYGSSEYGDSKYVDGGTQPIFDPNSVVPQDGQQNVSKNTLIKIDIYDPLGVIVPSSIQGWISGTQVYDGITGDFIPEYNGPLSAVTPKIIDGYNGYEITIDKVGFYRSGDSVLVSIYAVGN